MSGFEQLEGAVDQGAALRLQRPEDVAFSGQRLSDEVALGLVLQDVQIAEKYLQSKNRPTDWESSDNLYRGAIRPRVWPGTDVPRSNLPMPVVLEAVEKLMPILYLAFFSDKQPFLLEPLGKSTEEQMRANEKILLWCVSESDFKEQIRLCLKDWLLYGMTAAKWGWATEVRTKKEFKLTRHEETQKRQIEKVEAEYEISHPTFDHSELRNVMFDSSLRTHDCRKGKFCVSQTFITADDLDAMREDTTYKNVPTRAELAEILANHGEPAIDSMTGLKPSNYRDLQAPHQTDQSTSDPLGQPLELLEYVTDDDIIVVLQRKVIIRNDLNEFCKKNWLSCAFIDVPGSAHGFGIAKLLAGEQRFQEGVQNSWVDSLALILNPTFQLAKGIGPGTQQIKLSPGKVINESGELKPLIQQSVTKEALDAVANSEMRAARRVGANGADEMPTQALRTAEGVNSFNQEVVGRLQYEIEIFANMIFIPALQAFLEMCKNNLQPDDIDRILSEADGKVYKADILELYDSKCEISVLSSTKLAARRGAAQLLPLLLQLVGQGPVQDALTAQGKKFNFVELLEQAVSLTGWDIDSLVVDATPEEIKQYADMKSSGGKAAVVQQQQQGAQQLEQQKFEHAQQLVEENGVARAGVQIVKHILTESGKTPETAIPQNPFGA